MGRLGKSTLTRGYRRVAVTKLRRARIENAESREISRKRKKEGRTLANATGRSGTKDASVAAGSEFQTSLASACSRSKRERDRRRHRGKGRSGRSARRPFELSSLLVAFCRKNRMRTHRAVERRSLDGPAIIHVTNATKIVQRGQHSRSTLTRCTRTIRTLVTARASQRDGTSEATRKEKRNEREKKRAARKARGTRRARHTFTHDRFA